VDTGASYVTISQRFAQRLGLDLSTSGLLKVRTAGGTREGRLARVQTIRVGTLSAQGVDVAVVDSLPEELDGLLGLSFLSRFSVRIDHAAGKVELSPRAP